MRDPADQAQDVVDVLTRAAVANATANRQGKLAPRGTCHNPRCEAEVEDPKLFCDIQCSREYDLAHRR